MKIFQEKQFLNRWWLLMLILAVIVIVVGSAYYATRNSEDDSALIASIISLAIAVPLVFSLLFVRLETHINDRGISAEFKPFKLTRKHYSWNEIEECYVKKFDPVTEYGGWGIRGLGINKKAYIVYGTRGIYILTKEKESFLVGTQRPDAAKEVISLYSSSKTKNEI